MEYNVTIKNINRYNLPSLNTQKHSKPRAVQTFGNNTEINKTTWSEFMKHSVNNQLQYNLTLDEANKLLNEETREIKLNPVKEYNALAEGDKKALAHLVKAGEILNNIFKKQEHEKGLEFEAELAKRAQNDELAAKTLEIYNIFNGIEDERKERTYLFKNVKLADGRNLYPNDVKAEEVAEFLKKNPDKIEEILSNNTIVKRTENGFEGVPYQFAFKKEYEAVAKELLAAAETSTHEGFTKYLQLQAKAMISTDPEDAYLADVAWIKLADAPLEFTISRESYDDKFTGEVLKDKELSKMVSEKGLSANAKDMIGVRVGIVDVKASRELADYKNHMRNFSKFLPLAGTYAQSVESVDPATGSKQTLVDVDLVYMGGDSGTSRPGVTLAQNLPNSDKLAAKRGAGNRNVFHKDMRKSFDPEVRQRFLTELIDESQRHLYSDDAEHLFTIGHELTHSLGPMKTAQGLDKKSALGDWGDAVEEAKADLGSILMSDYFVKVGKYTPQQMNEIMLTWAAGLLSQEPPSKAQAHGVRRVAQFNYMRGCGAITLDVDGKLKVHPEKMLPAVNSMLTEVIKLQLNGDADAAQKFFDTWFVWTAEQEYASKVLKSMKPRLYKKLNPVLADFIKK